MKPLEMVPMTARGGRIMPKMIFRSSWALALLASLLAPGISSAAPNSPLTSLHDSVVVDAAHGTAYVMSPKGGIDAIELATGNVRWKSEAGARPLLIKDGALVAQAHPGEIGELAIVTLDAQRGVETGRVSLGRPNGLRARVINGPSQSFHVRAFQANNDVVIEWSAYDGRRLQGMLEEEALSTGPGSVSAATTSGKALNGKAVLDFIKGTAVSVTAEKAQSLEDQARSVRTPGFTAASARQLASIDGQHVLRSERTSENGPFPSYRWTITNAAGATVGTADAAVSMAPFLVSGTRIFYVVRPSTRVQDGKSVQDRLRLRAVDLQTGAVMWESPIVDGVYRGPLPP
jgi:hypothetical protein